VSKYPICLVDPGFMALLGHNMDAMHMQRTDVWFYPELHLETPHYCIILKGLPARLLQPLLSKNWATFNAHQTPTLELTA
jgi:hypothetical protein